MTPHPTPTRVAFARDIEAGRIRWYNFVEPVAHHTVTARKVTSALVEFVHAGLAQAPQCDEGLSSIAELTVEGRAWLLSVTAREGEGPAATSPAAGPPAEAPTLTQIVEFLDPDGTLRAGHSTEDGAPA